MSRISLLTPVQLGPYALPNRIVLSPMTRNRSPGEVPNALNALYYAQRATAGLLITESTAISAQGQGWPDSPGLYTEAQIAGWQQVTQAVHDRGGRIFVQLWHCGRSSHPSTQPLGALPVGPSALAATGTARTREGRQPLPVPRALQLHEIPGLIEDYRIAAVNAQRAGFDGVEVHAANGFLIDQFLRDSSNRREDGYGGSAQNRCRLLMEVTAAVIGVWGRERVGVRLSPVSPSNYGLSDSAPDALLRTALDGLNGLGVAYLAMVEGSSNGMPATGDIDWAQARRHFRGLYMANNGYDLDKAQRVVQTGLADLVSFGRLYIANPDLVHRFMRQAPLNSLDESTVHAADARGYTDYPPWSGA